MLDTQYWGYISQCSISSDFIRNVLGLTSKMPSAIASHSPDFAEMRSVYSSVRSGQAFRIYAFYTIFKTQTVSFHTGNPIWKGSSFFKEESRLDALAWLSSSSASPDALSDTPPCSNRSRAGCKPACGSARLRSRFPFPDSPKASYVLLPQPRRQRSAQLPSPGSPRRFFFMRSSSSSLARMSMPYCSSL